MAFRGETGKQDIEVEEVFEWTRRGRPFLEREVSLCLSGKTEGGENLRDA